MLRSWKREFLDHASEVFENPRGDRKAGAKKGGKPEEGNRLVQHCLNYNDTSFQVSSDKGRLKKQFI